MREGDWGVGPVTRAPRKDSELALVEARSSIHNLRGELQRAVVNDKMWRVRLPTEGGSGLTPPDP